MKYTVKYGDSLRMIAQRELGDANLWIDIAELNKLSYPYISDTPSLGVVTAGDDILLPLDETELDEEVSLGVDLRLSSDKVNLTSVRGGDLGIDSSGDYDLVSGLDCLKQDIAHAQMTPLGTVPYHEDYGSTLTTLIGAKKDDNWKIKTQLELERVLRCDPRITDVLNVGVSNLSTGIKVDYIASYKGIIFTSGGDGIEEI